MNSEQIRQLILASPEALTLAREGKSKEVAEILSIGRLKFAPTDVGNGTVLEVLGFTVGNALLDVISNVSDYRHVKPLLEQGRLRLDSPLTRIALEALVPSVLQQSHVEALIERAKVPDPINEFDVRKAIFADDGSILV